MTNSLEGSMWAEFQELQKTTPLVGPGSTWISLDVHLHTPASDDYKDRAGGYDALAAALGAADLDAVFVTDHNTAEGYDLLCAAVRRANVKTTIYPGAELSIPVPVMNLGNLTRDEKKVKEAFFHCLALLPPSNNASAQVKNLVTKSLTKMDVWDLPPSQRKVQQTLEEISEAVSGMGGLLVPAHLNQGKAPSDSRSFDDIYDDPTAIRLLNSTFTSAVEIRKTNSLEFFDGAHRGSNGNLIPERTCLLGSDAHDPSRIGAEKNYVKVESNTFTDIAAALHYRERVRFTKPLAPESRLEEIIVQGAFLQTKRIQLSDEMTALIGAKGSGKTALLECIRFVVGLTPDTDLTPYLTHVLGATGRVWASAETKKYGRVLFVRSLGWPVPRVFAADGAELSFEAVREALDITIRGWGEVTALAQNVDAQRRLIDGFDRSLAIEKVSHEIYELASAAPALYQHVVASLQNLNVIRQRRDELRRTAERLKRLQVTKIVDEQEAKERRERERLRFARLLDLLRTARDTNASGLPAGFTEIVSEVDSELTSGILYDSEAASSAAARSSTDGIGEPDSIWQETSGAIAEFSVRDADAREKRRVAFDEAVKRIEVAQATYEVRNAPLEAAYETLIASLPQYERDTLMRRNQIIQETAQLPEVDAQYKALSSEVEGHIKRLVEHLQNEKALIAQRTELRGQALLKIKGELTQKKIPTRVTLVSALDQQDGKAFDLTLTEISGLTAESALERFFKSGYENTAARPDFEARPDDRPVIEFELYQGEWRASDRLSAGQRSTAVLPLILLLSRGPVILDQPEDNLDNRYIGTTVVPLMLSEKSRRQVVITSHNATLVVMGDAELVIEMVDVSGHGTVQAWGFLGGPTSQMRTPILTVLDGGEEAFLRRMRKYYPPGHTF